MIDLLHAEHLLEVRLILLHVADDQLYGTDFVEGHGRIRALCWACDPKQRDQSGCTNISGDHGDMLKHLVAAR
jgi:hypothetical protein